VVFDAAVLLCGGAAVGLGVWRVIVGKHLPWVTAIVGVPLGVHVFLPLTSWRSTILLLGGPQLWVALAAVAYSRGETWARFVAIGGFLPVVGALIAGSICHDETRGCEVVGFIAGLLPAAIFLIIGLSSALGSRSRGGTARDDSTPHR
jgi:hypothetical protein